MLVDFRQGFKIPKKMQWGEYLLSTKTPWQWFFYEKNSCSLEFYLLEYIWGDIYKNL